MGLWRAVSIVSLAVFEAAFTIHMENR